MLMCMFTVAWFGAGESVGRGGRASTVAWGRTGHAAPFDGHLRRVRCMAASAHTKTPSVHHLKHTGYATVTHCGW